MSKLFSIPNPGPVGRRSGKKNVKGMQKVGREEEDKEDGVAEDDLNEVGLEDEQMVTSAEDEEKADGEKHHEEKHLGEVQRTNEAKKGTDGEEQQEGEEQKQRIRRRARRRIEVDKKDSRKQRMRKKQKRWSRMIRKAKVLLKQEQEQGPKGVEEGDQHGESSPVSQYCQYSNKCFAYQTFTQISNQQKRPVLPSHTGSQSTYHPLIADELPLPNQDHPTPDSTVEHITPIPEPRRGTVRSIDERPVQGWGEYPEGMIEWEVLALELSNQVRME